MEQKFYDLDVKVTEIQTAVEQLQDDMQERRGRTTTHAFAIVPRGPRSSAVPVANPRATTSTPATASLQLPLQPRLRPRLQKASSLECSGLHHHLKIKPERRSSAMHFLGTFW